RGRAPAPFGRLAFYGMASREQPSPVQLPNLMRFSTSVGGMWLPHAFLLPGNVIGRSMSELFSLVVDGSLRPIVGTTYPLSEARRAHEDLRGRKTMGKLTLDPSADPKGATHRGGVARSGACTTFSCT